ncbi:DNA adenine methylase [Pseudoflavitalea sp. X16]|uniref:DNA adenine methylase n=1 Tax=Paraflavitalea devenefica TaxID=2716334 RepID=UPI001422A167|nr:DNA adenine methylase [Paraflavitalea devenefica]NII26177.1 DNA adenine methylase [Paraflavitalea devenefica]
MKSLLTYYGGKQKLAPLINTLIPPHQLYGEPFVGGGAVFWIKRPSEVEVINDSNGELINFYHVVKHNYDGLISLINDTLHHRRQHIHAWVIYLNPELFSPVQRAWAVWVLASQSFAARLDGNWGFDLEFNVTTKKIMHSRDEFTRLYATRLEQVQLESKDALYIIRSRDTVDSFFYCDPPYYNSDMGHYKGYTKRDFYELLETLASIEGKFLLSSYPSSVLAAFVSRYGWHQQTIEQTVSINIKSGKGKPKTEVLTANYILEPQAPQLVLFDDF